MARGALRAVVCTSTLDLGIDWGDVDLVIQLASPKGASRMVQRIGRANHRLDEPSRALFVPGQPLRDAGVPGRARGDRRERARRRAGARRRARRAGPARDGPAPAPSRSTWSRSTTRSATAGPYRDLAWEDFEQVVDFVSTGGYALKTYDRFRRIVKGLDGLWRVRNDETALRHRMNVGAIVSPAMLSVRIAGRRGDARPQDRRGRGGLPRGPGARRHLHLRRPGLAAGRRRPASTCWCSPRRGKPAKMPSWGGSKFALSTFLAAQVRQLMSDGGHWERAAATTPASGWRSSATARPSRPRTRCCWRPSRTAQRHFMVAYPFEGRLAHTTLAMLLTRRLERLGVGPLGFVCNDYAADHLVAEADGRARLGRAVRRGHAGRRPRILAARELDDEAAPSRPAR